MMGTWHPGRDLADHDGPGWPRSLASSSSSVRGLYRAGLPVGRHLACSVKERGEDGVDLAGGQQGGTVAKAG
jgi:hypothetical protein